MKLKYPEAEAEEWVPESTESTEVSASSDEDEEGVAVAVVSGHMIVSKAAVEGEEDIVGSWGKGEK